jgi:hypothetical protein
MFLDRRQEDKSFLTKWKQVIAQIQSGLNFFMNVIENHDFNSQIF